jgi:hypothetical protein
MINATRKAGILNPLYDNQTVKHPLAAKLVVPEGTTPKELTDTTPAVETLITAVPSTEVAEADIV